ncbi:hypothetical protein [Moraxella lacunata]|uniref:hypothetical protein n=1 Tax=Moraxella lacunata TaxID=477 RepID=UPI003EDEF862
MLRIYYKIWNNIQHYNTIIIKKSLVCIKLSSRISIKLSKFANNYFVRYTNITEHASPMHHCHPHDCHF